jgi:hypothetical protein
MALGFFPRRTARGRMKVRKDTYSANIGRLVVYKFVAVCTTSPLARSFVSATAPWSVKCLLYSWNGQVNLSSLAPWSPASFGWARRKGALAHQTWSSLMSSFGRTVTKHFLTGSTSAQPLLTRHCYSSVLMSLLTLMLRLHPSTAQTTHSYLIHAQSQIWALIIIEYLPLVHTWHLMNLIDSIQYSIRTLFRDFRV